MTIGLPPQQMPFAIPGGNDALPIAMAAALGKRIQYNSTVKRIEQTKSKVRITVLKNNASRVIEAEQAVCTLPFSALRTVEFSPGLGLLKSDAVQALRYGV